MSREKVIQCKRYLEDKLGEPLPHHTLDESSGDMKVFTISNIDTYHKVAESLNVTKLLKKRNLYYNIDLPHEPNWSIILSREQVVKFEEKYGRKYDIHRVRDRPICTNDLYR